MKLESKINNIADLQKQVKLCKKSASSLRVLSSKEKNDILQSLADNIRKNEKKIIEYNKYDLEAADKNNISAALKDRLALNVKRIQSIADAVVYIKSLPDPVSEVTEGRTLSNGLKLSRIRVPLGVVGSIYESRPNVTIDIGALCLKSGNATVLRGGKEALYSNTVLADIFRQTLKEAGLPEAALTLIDNTNRELIPPLLQMDKEIDLIVPRGGEALIRFVSQNSSIPVVKHDKGVCQIYVSESAKEEMTKNVVINSKVQRPSVCNALENLIIDKAYPHKEKLLKALKDEGLKLLGDNESRKIYPSLKELTETGYDTEYLDLRLAVKFVDGLSEAVSFIEQYSSGHSEGILSNDYLQIQEFTKRVDSAALFINCSTRFHDGGQFGMGAEVGISTGKMHVRGPMSLQDLTSTKFIITGEGQIRE